MPCQIMPSREENGPTFAYSREMKALRKTEWNDIKNKKYEDQIVSIDKGFLQVEEEEAPSGISYLPHF